MFILATIERIRKYCLGKSYLIFAYVDYTSDFYSIPLNAISVPKDFKVQDMNEECWTLIDQKENRRMPSTDKLNEQ